jgi:hypothetical protein
MRKKREELARKYSTRGSNRGTRAPYAQSKPNMQQGLQTTVQRQDQMPELPTLKMYETKALEESIRPDEVEYYKDLERDMDPSDIEGMLKFMSLSGKKRDADLSDKYKQYRELEGRRYAGLDEPPEVADPELQAMMSYLVDKGSFGDTRPEMAEAYLEELRAQRDAQKAESDLLEMLRNLPKEGGE